MLSSGGVARPAGKSVGSSSQARLRLRIINRGFVLKHPVFELGVLLFVFSPSSDDNNSRFCLNEV